MTTNVNNAFAGDSTFNPARAASIASTEMHQNNGLVSFLDTVGATQTHYDLSKYKGSVVNLYDQNKRDSKGRSGDGDAYSSATRNKTSSRTMSIDLLADDVKTDLKGTMAAQVRSFDPNSTVVKQSLDWLKRTVLHSYMNHLGGNTAATQYVTNYSQALTDSEDILRYSGFNAVSALPAANMIFAGGKANETAVGADSTAIVKKSDLENIDAIASSIGGSGHVFETFDGSQGYKYIALTPVSMWYQLEKDSTGINRKDTYYNMLAGGTKQTPTVKGIMMNSYILDEVLYVKLPDIIFARGNSGGTPIANTRRMIVLGANALDVAYGQGYDGGSSDEKSQQSFTGTEVLYDDSNQKNNGQAVTTIKRLWGCKRADFSNSAGSATYPNVFTITGYTAL